ncbi:MAG: hypothetical protein CME62_08530 [Halobacteriovoraceae bacterium]|nr:hypothetical protein [Halobacteriovoraceae bacterium]
MKATLLILLICLSSLGFAEDTSELLAIEKRIIHIYQKTSPMVVSVANIKVAKNWMYGEEVEVPQGAGSGFVWDDDGHIVTNFHVVEGGDSFMVTFNDKKQYHAKIVGVDPKNDIAVLKLKKNKLNLKGIPKGSSKDLQVGQLSLAIGNPMGFEHSLSRGIVSAIGRKMQGIGGVKIHDMIQTDAAINQGNSGGPLLNSKGEVIGMNTMIVSRSGGSAGLGFAVPIDTINRSVPQLIKFGKVIRPGLGIGVLDDHVKQRFLGDKGVALSYVDPDGAAASAGLKGMMRDNFGRIYVGDVIMKVDGKPVNSLDEIYHVLGGYEIGDRVEIEYMREDKTHKVKVKLKAL